MNANDKFKEAMSLVPTSVGVVWRSNDRKEISGCTISSFISISVQLENEVIAFVLRNDSRTGHMISKAGDFKISILSKDQVEIANIFSKGLSIVELNSAIEAYPTWIESTICEFSLKFQQQIHFSNSTIFVADVISFLSRPKIEPLIYSARKFT